MAGVTFGTPKTGTHLPTPLFTVPNATDYPGASVPITTLLYDGFLLRIM